jgi:hypothetical protein
VPLKIVVPRNSDHPPYYTLSGNSEFSLFYIDIIQGYSYVLYDTLGTTKTHPNVFLLPHKHKM